VNVRWAESAIADFTHIFDYIAADNENAAIRVLQRIDTSIQRAARMPYSGRIGHKPGTREIPVPGTRYIVVYKIIEETVYIASILHGAQDWPKSF
jgi:addiction module RelE/StbE family toxin